MWRDPKKRCFVCGTLAHAWQDYSCHNLGTHRFATPEEWDRSELQRRLAALIWVSNELQQIAETLGKDRGVLTFDRLEVETLTLKNEVQDAVALFIKALGEDT